MLSCLALRTKYLLVDHGVENLAAECLDLRGFDKDRQPALLGLKAQSVIELGPEDCVVVNGGDDAVDEFGQGPCSRRDTQREAEC